MSLRWVLAEMVLLLLQLLMAVGARSHAGLASVEECLERGGVRNYTTPGEAIFYHLLEFSAQNLRFAGASPPALLVLPESTAEVQTAFLCALGSGLPLRIRSGGHDYEGLSFTADSPFFLLDLMNLDHVDVDVEARTAWAQAGITLGQLYYAISQASPELGFPAGVCPTVCAGGHISGGGYSFMSRKHGLAADNVLDALLVNSTGALLDRVAMGEDLFWAIRGGGGGSFGIVVAWKLQLAAVAPRVTAFNAFRANRTAISEVVHAWQTVAPSVAPPELQIVIYLYGGQTVSEKLVAMVYGYYMGGLQEALDLMTDIFPELALTEGECSEGSWIDAVANVGRAGSPAGLAQRFLVDKNYFKAKSDYVQTPLSKSAWDGAFDMIEANPSSGSILFEPYGAAMASIPSNHTPFPHRRGNLYVLQYHADWTNTSFSEPALLRWSRALYAYMEPFVSQNPRQAYVGYLDLDLGENATYAGAAATWGPRYFGDNFKRLAQIKAQVDPDNVFRHPQSIPLYAEEEEEEEFTCLASF